MFSLFMHFYRVRNHATSQPRNFLPVAPLPRWIFRCHPTLTLYACYPAEHNDAPSIMPLASGRRGGDSNPMVMPCVYLLCRLDTQCRCGSGTTAFCWTYMRARRPLCHLVLHLSARTTPESRRRQVLRSRQISHYNGQRQ